MTTPEHKWFVILNHPNGGYVPMTDGDEGEMGFYTSYDEAYAGAVNNDFGDNFGFEVFEAG